MYFFTIYILNKTKSTPTLVPWINVRYFGLLVPNESYFKKKKNLFPHAKDLSLTIIVIIIIIILKQTIAFNLLNKI